MTTDKFPYIMTLLQIQIKRLGLRTIVDVGAYDGGRAARFAKANRRAVIHAIEPCSVPALRVQGRIYANIRIHEIAIADHDGIADLHIDAKSPMSNSLYSQPAGNSDATVRVPCCTLGTFCGKNRISQIDMLMLNCEGSEYDIFGHAASKAIVGRVQCLDLLLHGKAPLFLSPEYVAKKVAINEFLVESGLQVIYGDVLTDRSKLHFGHIRQVWVRK